MNDKTNYLFTCSLCAVQYPPSNANYTCEACSGNLDIHVDFGALNPEAIWHSEDQSMWRYEPMLPVSRPHGDLSPLHAVGWTPIYRPQSLAQEMNVSNLYVKDEGRNPTASLKDRASASVVAHALETKTATIITASSGNAGAALAGMCASAQLEAIILVPKSAPQAKIAQLLIYGSRVFLVDGNYDDAFDLTVKASKKFGWYCRNTGYNPFTVEGKKTAAFEIWEQLPAYFGKNSDRLNIFVSVGDGNIISGVHKGFKDLAELGWIETMPRIYGIQAEGSAAISKAFNQGVELIEAVDGKTLADSICVCFPRDGVRALRAVKETGGTYLTVTDREILAGMKQIGRFGIFGEPAAAAAFAGYFKAIEEAVILRHQPALVLNTGNGLKDISAAVLSTGDAPIIEPNLRALQRIMGL